jgi:hypothetical protein
MANFTPKKIDTSTINSGQEYTDDDFVTPSAINSPIESGLYTEIIADGLTQAPDISQIAGSGTPTVEFVDGTTVNGVKTKKFAFKNLVGGGGYASFVGYSGNEKIVVSSISTSTYFDVPLTTGGANSFVITPKINDTTILPLVVSANDTPHYYPCVVRTLSPALGKVGLRILSTIHI